MADREERMEYDMVSEYGQQRALKPVLEHLSDGSPKSLEDLSKKCGDLINPTPSEVNIMAASMFGVMMYRMEKNGWVTRDPNVAMPTYRMTDKGRKALASIGDDVLAPFREY